MPIYEYECEQCKDSFSLLLKITANTGEVTCPSCGGIARKKISACAIGTSAEGPSCSIGGG